MNCIEPCVPTMFGILFVSYWGHWVQTNGPEIIVQFGMKTHKFLTQNTVNIVKFVSVNTSLQMCKHM